MAALLRIDQDNRFIMFHTPHTPNTFGPPGGVFKVLPRARPYLHKMEFRGQRHPNLASDMTDDLRGYIPARFVLKFLAWYRSGDGVETVQACLRRELREELEEVGHPELIPFTDHLQFLHVRSINESPYTPPNQLYKQIRRMEIYEIDPDATDALKLRRRLFMVADDPTDDKVIWARPEDIIDGRSGENLIGPQAAYLLGTKRYRDDFPSLRY